MNVKKRNTFLVAFLVSALALAGIGGFALAGPGYGHGGYHGGMGGGYGYHGGGHGGRGGCGGYGPGGYGGGYYGPGAAINPEAQKIVEKAYLDSAPLFLELRAKKEELAAKIYSGADDATVDNLNRQVLDLQSRLNNSRVAMHKALAKAGVPLASAMSNCPVMGFGGMGFHHGAQRGIGFHGNNFGPCPGWGSAPQAGGDRGAQ
jgi:hypothetical protein